jgi:hypothetical protein
MKRAIFPLLFALCAFTFVAAQPNGNGNGYGNYGNWNGNGPAANVNAWASNWPQWVIAWLNQGGQVPAPLALVVIHEARAWGQAQGLNQVQMIQKYANGQLTIEYQPTSPPSLTFNVRYGGNQTLVVLEDLF